LAELSLIEELLPIGELPGTDHPKHPAVGSVDTEDSLARVRLSEIEVPGLHPESGGIRQQSDSERILEGLFDVSYRQRTIQSEWRIVPVELHETDSNANANAM
jgi:hypothetical protein